MEIQPKPSGWEMTDPRQHNPKSFRYIVTTTSKSSIKRAAQRSRSWGETETPVPDDWEGLVNEMLARNSLSCTVIDEGHTATFKQDVMPQAFILKVPSENIVGLDYTDLGTMYEVQDKAKREGRGFFQSGQKLLKQHPDAQSFIEQCSPFFRNEVLVDGVGPLGRKISLEGVIFFTRAKSRTPLYEQYSRYSWDPRMIASRIWRFGDTDEAYVVRRYRQEYRDSQELARQRDLPVIHIPAPF